MKHIFMYMAIMVMLLSSCSSRNDVGDQKSQLAADLQLDSTKLEDEQFAAPNTATAAYDNSIRPARKPTTVDYVDWDKKIIKTAEITLELKDYQAYDRQLHTNLRSYGAYIATEEQSHSAERMTNSITIKVPVAQFENLVNSFGGEGVQLLQKKIGTNDVTAEVIDTRSRMEAKKQVRDRYMQLLNQARNMKEILQVQQEINSIQEEIESAAGRVNYLGHQSAYSTVYLQYFQLTGVPAPRIDNGFFVKLEQGFNAGVHFVGNILVLLVTIWPLLLLIGIVLIWIRRKTLRVLLNEGKG